MIKILKQPSKNYILMARGIDAFLAFREGMFRLLTTRNLRNSDYYSNWNISHHDYKNTTLVNHVGAIKNLIKIDKKEFVKEFFIETKEYLYYIEINNLLYIKTHTLYGYPFTRLYNVFHIEDDRHPSHMHEMESGRIISREEARIMVDRYEY